MDTPVVKTRKQTATEKVTVTACQFFAIFHLYSSVNVLCLYWHSSKREADLIFAIYVLLHCSKCTVDDGCPRVASRLPVCALALK